MRSDICITLSKELKIIQKMKSLIVQCQLASTTLGRLDACTRISGCVSNLWTRVGCRWGRLSTSCRGSQDNLEATAPTAVLINAWMDEKEIHSKSTLKRRHLIPETLTGLTVARGSQRGDRQVQSEDVYGSSLSFCDMKEINQDKP